MCLKGRPDGELTRAMRLALACCLILLPICSHAQSGSQDTYVGNFYWYDPSHDKWVPTEFYAAASADSPVTRFTRKTRMQVVAARRGWLAIRPAAGAEATTIVFMPVGTFRFRLYKDKASSTFDVRTALAAFERASLFADDPDILKRRFEKKADEPKESPNAKSSAKLKPWQKYKENWGSVTPAPKKNKHSLLDDIKQPGAADAMPAADAAPAADAKP